MSEPFHEIDRTLRPIATGLTVGTVTVSSPSGVLHRTFLHTPEVVAVIAVVDGALLLVREYRAAVGAHVLSLPMGKVPDGADPAGAAAAELAEETGHRAGRVEPLGRLLACPGWMDQVVHAFRARDCVALDRRPASDDPDDVEEQHLSVVAVPLDEIAGAVARGDLCDARTLAVLYLAGDLNR